MSDLETRRGQDERTGAENGTTEEWRTTRYSDVCGGTDELKRLLIEEPAAANSAEGRATLRGLVDDAQYMLARMEVRLREYQAFRDELAAIVAQMREIAEPRLHDSTQEGETLRALLQREGPLPADELIQRAEAVRQVANDMEGALRRHKVATIAAGRAYLALKGARGWDDGATAEAGTAGSTNGAEPRPAPPLPPSVEAWLPPSPHRELIVDWLGRGRAALLSEEEVASYPVGPQGREPLVQFEDGGVMPLRVVRWSEEVRNFYPLGATPHPRGRMYRR